MYSSERRHSFADDVIVTAVVRQRWRPAIPGLRCEVDLCLHANSLVVLNSRKAHIEVDSPTAVKLDTAPSNETDMHRHDSGDHCQLFSMLWIHNE